MKSQLGVHSAPGEALALEEKRWDDWLALYADGCEFWTPAWTGDDRLGADPRTVHILRNIRLRATAEGDALKLGTAWGLSRLFSALA